MVEYKQVMTKENRVVLNPPRGLSHPQITPEEAKGLIEENKEVVKEVYRYIENQKEAYAINTSTESTNSKINSLEEHFGPRGSTSPLDEYYFILGKGVISIYSPEPEKLAIHATNKAREELKEKIESQKI